MRQYLAVMMVAATGLLAFAPTARAETTVSHGIAIHGAPQLPPDFPHLPYVNPDAPKGGSITLSTTGSFDSFNPFTIKGQSAAGIALTFETLGTGSDDKPAVEYGLLAESFEVPDDRSWVAFTLREEARFHDGEPVKPEDVIWTFETLKEEGPPFYRFYFGDVSAVTKTGPRTVRFDFSGTPNNELPVIVSQLPVLPKHYWESRDITATTLEPPLGSGPYRVKSFDAGRTVTYERVPDYWGAALPINRGRHNFEEVSFDYYRDGTIAFEAFKSGEFDFRVENVTKNWATGYDIPAVSDGFLVRETTELDNPEPMQGFVMNQRRPLFQDIRVREALVQFYDFETLNKTLFFGLLERPTHYFWSEEFAATGLPQGRELEILERYRDRLPARLFTEEFALPQTSGDGNIRPQLRTALGLFREAGWTLQDGRLVNAEGAQMRFEILLNSPTMERVALPFEQNLERAGIDVTIRTVDTAQYRNRVDSFDFDMVVGLFPQSTSPGNEQREFWSCAAAERPGSRNIMGLCDPVVDDLIERLIQAETREELDHHVRALDRVLLWGHHLVPQQRSRDVWLAFWDRFGRPDRFPRHGLGIVDTWWYAPEKAAAVDDYLNR